MRCKRIILEVSETFHNKVKKQAKELNITMKEYLITMIYPEIMERENLEK